MADEMLRVAGRGEDGLAKAIKTDDSGNILSKTAGNNLVYKEVVSTVSVAAGGVLNMELKPDDPKDIVKLVMLLYYNSGTIGGTTEADSHSLHIVQGPLSMTNRIYSSTRQPNSAIRIQGNQDITEGAEKTIIDETSQLNFFSNLIFSNDVPLTFQYINNSNGANSATKTIKVVYQVIGRV